jgi:DNA topoisomerase-3
LVDQGVTAQLECLLDDVVVGKQEMVGAIEDLPRISQSTRAAPDLSW